MLKTLFPVAKRDLPWVEEARSIPLSLSAAARVTAVLLPTQLKRPLLL